MNLEDRYVVIKRSDMGVLSRDDKRALSEICRKINRGRYFQGKEQLSCLVIEKDWPEYGPTLVSLSQRVDGKHKWRCVSPGEYDTTYQCKICGDYHTESSDNPETALPEFGCEGYAE